MGNPWEDYAQADGPWAEYQQGGKAKKTQTQIDGEQSPGLLKRAISTMQGPTMGFTDELAGVGGAIAGSIANLTPYGDGKSFSENYRDIRDTARAASESHMKENPISGHVERIAASIPVFAAKGPQMALGALQGTRAGQVLSKIPSSVQSGGVFGAISGMGETNASDAQGAMRDAAISSSIGAAFGPVLGGVINAGGAVANVVGQTGIGRAAQQTAEGIGNSVGNTAAGRYIKNILPGSPASLDARTHTFAQQKIAEAMLRDKAGVADPLSKASSRFAMLGDEATVADSSGANTRQLLDTLATLPGEAKQSVESLIRSRQAGRAGRLTDAAAEGLSPTGARLPETLTALDEARKVAAQPLYDQVRQTNLTVDSGLADVLKRASGAFSHAKELAKVNGDDFALDNLAPGMGPLLTGGQKNVPLSQLDTLKRTLYDIEQGHINPETGRLNEIGAAYKNLRRELIDHADRLTTDPTTGQSFYKAARDAYAGPTELRSAATLGNQAMSKDAWKIGEMTSGMSPTELEAFRIGAFESLRKKVGTEGGQTSLLKMWKEPATSEKLKELFSDEGSFRMFAAKVAKEGRLKLLEQTGRGSQTAARSAGMGDMDVSAISEAGNMAKAAFSGNPTGVLGGAASLWNRVKTPESVRNEMADILLSRGARGQNNINELRSVLDRVKSEKERRSSLAGMFVGAM